MIVLNYHRVDNKDPTDFYTISPAEFSNHLDAILELGLKTVSVDEIFSFEDRTDIIMLHFDDATKGHYDNVAPLLESSRMRGVFFVPTAKVGGDRYITVGQVQALSAKGHSIECHGHTHRRLDQLSADDLETELATSVSMITGWTGRSPVILAPPGGFFNDAVVNAAKRHGLRITRTMNWNSNRMPIRERLDCMVVTRATTQRMLRQWAQGRGITRMRIAFQVKQMIRSILPFGMYLQFRKLMGG